MSVGTQVLSDYDIAVLGKVIEDLLPHFRMRFDADQLRMKPLDIETEVPFASGRLVPSGKLVADTRLAGPMPLPKITKIDPCATLLLPTDDVA